MTLTELQLLSEPVLNERAAGCMGWELDGFGRYNAEFRGLVSFKVAYWEDDTLWNPSDNLIQAAELEAEIARRGLQDKYAETLATLVYGEKAEIFYNAIELESFRPEITGYNFVFKIATATPHLRTVAAVLTLQGEKQK